jgi:hypothetical protein
MTILSSADLNHDHHARRNAHEVVLAPYVESPIWNAIELENQAFFNAFSTVIKCGLRVDLAD